MNWLKNVFFLFTILFLNCSPKSSTKRFRSICPDHYSYANFGLCSKITLNKDRPIKCYLKSTHVVDETYPYSQLAIYDGNTVDAVFVEKFDLLDPNEKWEKRRRRNCRSFELDDCVIWCLVKPEVIKTYFVVNDTSLTDKYHFEKIEVKDKKSIVRTSKYLEVACKSRITLDFYQDLRAQLYREGYNVGRKKWETSRIKNCVKKAMIAFQKDNDLAVGSFNIETLDLLDIDLEIY